MCNVQFQVRVRERVRVRVLLLRHAVLHERWTYNNPSVFNSCKGNPSSLCKSILNILFWLNSSNFYYIIENQFIYKQHKIARAQYVNIFSSKKVTVLPSWRQSILLPPTCNMLVSWVELSTLRILRNLHLFHVVFVTCPSFFLLFPRFLFFLSLLFLCELACAVVSAVAIRAVPSAGDSMASALTTLRQVGTLMPIRPLVFYTFISLPMLPKKIISMNTTKISAC